MGVKYEFPVINSFMESSELKYFFSFSKFDIKIDPEYIFYINDRPDISFFIDSEVSTIVDMTIYFRSINEDAFTPSLNYPKTVRLKEGFEENEINVQFKTLTDKGVYELCIDIADTSFFSRNAYSKCPTVIHITNILE